jgi:hypothetical protein
MDIFSSLPFPSGTANIPKNVMKNDDFYRAKKSVNFFGITVSIFYFWGADVS